MLIQPIPFTDQDNQNELMNKSNDRYQINLNESQQKVDRICKDRLWQLAISFIIICLIVKYNYQQKQSYSSLQELYSFRDQGYVIEPTQPLHKNYTLTQWPQLSNQTITGKVTVVFTTSKRSELLDKTLTTFFQYNTYPVEKIIVVQDGEIYKQLELLCNKYKNITWVFTNKKIGQIAAIDVAYQFIQTQYYFHSEDDWEYLRPGFMEYCFLVEKLQPNVGGLYLRFTFKPETLIKKGLIYLVNYPTYFFCCYSFNPSIRKLSQYTQIPGGYSNLTYFSSFGKGAGDAQGLINLYFYQKGYINAQSHIQFIKHLGLVQGGGGQKFISQKNDDRKKLDLAYAYRKFFERDNQKRQQQIDAGIESKRRYHILDNITTIMTQIWYLYQLV